MPEGQVARELALGFVGAGIVGEGDRQALFRKRAQAGVELVVELRRDLAETRGEAADPQRFEMLLQRLEHRADLLDMRAEILEALRRGHDEIAHLRIGLHMAEVEAETDLPAAHAGVEADRVVARLGRQRSPVTRIGTSREVQRHRGVEHRARQDALADHVGEGCIGRRLRDASIGRLQADEPGMGCGNADRTAAIVAMVEWIDARRRERRGAAGRAAGRVGDVPRIARRALERRVGQSLPAELGRRGLAKNDHAPGKEPVDDGGVLDSRGLVRGMRSQTCRPSLYVRRVLDRRRNPVERRERLAFLPARFRSLCGTLRAFRIDQHERVQMRLQR